MKMLLLIRMFIMAKLRDFGIDLQKALEKIGDDLSEDIQSELIDETPIDTGYARSRWIAQRPRFTLQNGQKINNDCGYMTILNDGHSKQAPALFIEGVLERETSKSRSIK